jgi:hypothetical protein
VARDQEPDYALTQHNVRKCVVDPAVATRGVRTNRPCGHFTTATGPVKGWVLALGRPRTWKRSRPERRLRPTRGAPSRCPVWPDVASLSAQTRQRERSAPPRTWERTKGTCLFFRSCRPCRTRAPSRPACRLR